MVATPKCREGAYCTPRERQEFGDFDCKCFNHHVFYFAYSVTNVFYCAIKASKEVWGLASRKVFTVTFPTMPENAPLQASFTISIGKLQSTIFDIKRQYKDTK